MIKVIVIVGLVIAAFAIIAHLLRPKPVFLIEIADGKVSEHSGKLPQGFISDCHEIIESNEIQQGTISGAKDGERIRLKFSASIPEDSHQQFRNVWQLHGPRM